METSELVLPYLDDISGTIRGYRIFTACRTVNGKVFRMEDHLDRLYLSAAAIFMRPPLPRDELRILVQQVVDENRSAGFSGELLLDIIFSGGLAGSGMRYEDGKAHLYVAVQEMAPPTAEMYRNGVALASYIHQRMCPDVKLLNYIGAILAHQTVVPQHDAFEALFTSPPDGADILEGSTFSIFFVTAPGEIVTPPLDGRILDSVTRRTLLEIVKADKGVTITERNAPYHRLAEFQEAFLASTTRNVLPVVRIDDKIIGSGFPGPTTAAAAQILDNYMRAY